MVNDLDFFQCNFQFLFVFSNSLSFSIHASFPLSLFISLSLSVCISPSPSSSRVPSFCINFCSCFHTFTYTNRQVYLYVSIYKTNNDRTDKRIQFIECARFFDFSWIRFYLRLRMNSWLVSKIMVQHYFVEIYKLIPRQQTYRVYQYSGMYTFINKLGLANHWLWNTKLENLSALIVYQQLLHGFELNIIDHLSPYSFSLLCLLDMYTRLKLSQLKYKAIYESAHQHSLSDHWMHNFMGEIQIFA